MDLYIIRHAQAGHFGDPQWPDDGQRPLTDAGRQRFARMIETLAGRGFEPQIIATSPLVRCVQTAQVVAENSAGDPELVELDDLLPGGDLQSLLQWTAGQLDYWRQVAWVGHAPDVGRITSDLISEGDMEIRFAKGAIAAIRFHGPPEIGHGELRWLVTAKVVGC